MTYFIFQVKQSAGARVKNLLLLEKHVEYKPARAAVRQLRSANSDSETLEYKMVFAESQLEAEELLQEKRDTPILMEWEK